MRKILKIVSLLFLSVLVLFIAFYSPFIFQEGNPIPVLYGVVKVTTSGNSYVKVSEYKYIVKANAEDEKKLTDYLAQNGLMNTDRGGAALFFKDKQGKSYTATIRMYTHNFEILDFGNQQGLILP